jgi:hypothetical protein
VHHWFKEVPGQRKPVIQDDDDDYDYYNNIGDDTTYSYCFRFFHYMSKMILVLLNVVYLKFLVNDPLFLF